MATKTKQKPGRKKVHRLTVMANIEDGGRAVAAIPLFQPGQPYPLGLSLQRLHGPSFGGQTGFVVRMVGADGTVATMVLAGNGRDPATIEFKEPERTIDEAKARAVQYRRPAVAGDRQGPQPSDDASQEEIDEYDALLEQGLTPDQAAAKLRARGAGDDLSDEDRRVQAAADAELDPLPGQGQDGF